MKKTIFSGVAPSGNLHIGNYLGAILQWVEMQKEADCIFCVVNYHAITVPQNPKQLLEKSIEVAKIYLASGIDPKKSAVFLQSDIKEHAELAWILNCTGARMSDLKNMTQFKDKSSKKGAENVSVGLFDYPVLMAADILLYQTDVVPVGEDQIQHVELTRDLARRFNQNYGEVFKIPEVKIKKEGARIMGLDNPSKKMSKSTDSINSYIALLDSPELAEKKIKKAVTDSGSEIEFNLIEKPAITNMLNIYSLLSGQKIAAIEKEYAGQGYGAFKAGLATVVKEFLVDFQKKYQAYSDDDVRDILAAGAKKIIPMARETMKQVKEKMGIL